MPPPLEIEVKLALASQAMHDGLLRALGRPARTLLQRNAFFDGARGEISAARIALRVREERTVETASAAVRTWVTMKHGGSESATVHERVEWEEEIGTPLDELRADPARLLALPVEPVGELLRLVPGLSALVFLGEFSNERKEVPVELEVGEPGGGVRRLPTLWEVDRIAFGDRAAEYELEVELPPAARAASLSAEALSAAVQDRLRALGVEWRPQPRSKYARFRRYCLGAKD